METQTCDQLRQKRCQPCEGGVDKLTADESQAQIGQLTGWEFRGDSQRIRKRWIAKNFVTAMDFFQKVAELAEEEGHHPDLHLEGYRNASIDIWTHAIGGLSENDFILAAKIDLLPIELKSG